MARLILDLPTDLALALRRAANEADASREATAFALLRDALIAAGHLEPVHELDEDTETKGAGMKGDRQNDNVNK